MVRDLMVAVRGVLGQKLGSVPKRPVGLGDEFLYGCRER
jgi:hypothetical protein